MKITAIRAVEILDSRGNPTVRTFVTVDGGAVGVASVPSGASTGTHEALELRDGGRRYGGRGVTKAVKNVNSSIAKKLVGVQLDDLAKVDAMLLQLDTSENKSALGANALLSVSLAIARAHSVSHGQPLWKSLHEVYFDKTSPSFPRLLVNVVNGGRHAQWNFDIQEFMVSPKSELPSKSVQQAAEIFHSLGNLLKKKGLSTLVGDEGGYSPELPSNEAVFDILEDAISSAGYDRDIIDIAIDAAASEFYKNGKYHFKRTGVSMTSNELVHFYLKLQQKYHLVSYEDPFSEDDWDGFGKLTKEIGSNTLVIGDDLFVTNPKRIEKGIEKISANAVLIKVNQIGSLTETVQAIQMCRDADWSVVISHRSGETEDPFIADLAYASGAEFIKTGSMSRSDRLAKYNRLLEIESLEI